MTAEALALREEWKKLLALQYAAQEAAFLFDARVMRAKAAVLCPPGHSIDYLDDGEVKLDAACSRTLKE